MSKNLREHLRKARAKQKANAVVWTPRPEILCCPRIPKPLHGVNPRTIAGKKWWDKTRRAAYRSTNHHCLACGVSQYDAKLRQWLEGHELYEVDWLLGRAYYVETVPLCHSCHCYIHPGRLRALIDRGMISHQKFAIITQHGDAVLSAAGLERTEYPGPFAPWEDWRMVFDGVEYPPIYKSEDEWQSNISKGISDD